MMNEKMQLLEIIGGGPSPTGSNSCYGPVELVGEDTSFCRNLHIKNQPEIIRPRSNKAFSRSKLNIEIKSEVIEFLASLWSNRKCKKVYGWSKIHSHVAGSCGGYFCLHLHSF